MKLYLAVSKDEFKLPLIVADSLKELSEFTGASVNTIASSISKGYGAYERVIIDDEEDE